MKSNLQIRRPQWNEKKVLRCKKCEEVFIGIKILFFTKCPKCGSHNVEEDNRIVY